MKEVHGDLWDQGADVVVITTNGSVKRTRDATITVSTSRAIMGRGVALQAKVKFPRLPAALGGMLEEKGNHVHYLGAFLPMAPRDDCNPTHLISFPVKDHWKEGADTALIHRSTIELYYLVHIILPSADIKTDVVAMPRPGCGCGRLSWSVVKPIVEPHLDDRFVIVERRD